MADIERRLNKTAFKKAVTWGTEIDVNVAGAGLAPLNAGVPALKVTGIEENSAVSAFESDLDQGDFGAVDFGLDFDWRYAGLENVLVAMVMGTAGTPAQQGATAAYLHTLQLASKIAGIFGTYATEKLDKIHVVPAVKPHKLTITYAGGLLRLAVACRGDKVIDDSAIITALANVTIPDRHNRALARHNVFRMNLQSGAALASPTDDVKIKDFTLEIERKIDSVWSSQSRAIVEPAETDKPTIKFTLNLNRMDAANKLYFAQWIAETEKKADLIFTGALIASTYYYYLKFQFPRLKLEDVEYPDANVIPAKVILRGLEADTAPEGMTGITKPVQFNVMNTRTTDLLA